MSTSVSLDTLGETVVWPDSGAIAPTDIVNVIRQPSPPPMLAPVQTLQEALGVHDHMQPQLQPSDLAHPGPSHVSEDDFTQSKGPKSLHIVRVSVLIPLSGFLCTLM